MAIFISRYFKMRIPPFTIIYQNDLPSKRLPITTQNMPYLDPKSISITKRWEKKKRLAIVFIHYLTQLPLIRRHNYSHHHPFRLWPPIPVHQERCAIAISVKFLNQCSLRTHTRKGKNKIHQMQLQPFFSLNFGQKSLFKINKDIEPCMNPQIPLLHSALITAYMFKYWPFPFAKMRNSIKSTGSILENKETIC